MKIYLWTMVVLQSINIIGSLIWLVRGKFPDRTANGVAIGTVVSVAFLVWAFILVWGI